MSWPRHKVKAKRRAQYHRWMLRRNATLRRQGLVIDKEGKVVPRAA